MKFTIEFKPGGWCYIFWKNIFISKGRPWIKDWRLSGYSELLCYLWDHREEADWIGQPFDLDDLIG